MRLGIILTVLLSLLLVGHWSFFIIPDRKRDGALVTTTTTILLSYKTFRMKFPWSPSLRQPSRSPTISSNTKHHSFDIKSSKEIMINQQQEKNKTFFDTLMADNNDDNHHQHHHRHHQNLKKSVNNVNNIHQYSSRNQINTKLARELFLSISPVVCRNRTRFICRSSELLESVISDLIIFQQNDDPEGKSAYWRLSGSFPVTLTSFFVCSILWGFFLKSCNTAQSNPIITRKSTEPFRIEENDNKPY